MLERAAIDTSTESASYASHAVPEGLVVATSVALPPHRYEQADLVDLVERVLPSLGVSRKSALLRLFQNVGVQTRHFALPAEQYARLDGFGERSRVFNEVALELGDQALRSALAESGLDPRDLGELVTTTVTGIAVPSLDARLMNRIRFAPTLRRVPIFGLGCAGGAAGLARIADYLRAYPKSAAALLSVELCSLTLQQDDLSVPNLISSGLFGDGAAAVIAVGAEHPLAARGAPALLGSRSVHFPSTEHVMGWEVVDRGFRVVLSADVPTIARTRLPSLVTSFLDAWGLERDAIATWISHPGGPKVMDSIEAGLELPKGTLDPSREALARAGNLSSASVLLLLDEFRRHRRPAEGSFGLLLAMGPAFAAEMVLLRW